MLVWLCRFDRAKKEKYLHSIRRRKELFLVTPVISAPYNMIILYDGCTGIVPNILRRKTKIFS